MKKPDTFAISFWLFCIYAQLAILTLGVWEIGDKL